MSLQSCFTKDNVCEFIASEHQSSLVTHKEWISKDSTASSSSSSSTSVSSHFVTIILQVDEFQLIRQQIRPVILRDATSICKKALVFPIFTGTTPMPLLQALTINQAATGMSSRKVTPIFLNPFDKLTFRRMFQKLLCDNGFTKTSDEPLDAKVENFVDDLDGVAFAIFELMDKLQNNKQEMGIVKGYWQKGNYEQVLKKWLLCQELMQSLQRWISFMKDHQRRLLI